MRLVWSSLALADLERLHQFLAPVNLRAAGEAVREIVGSEARLRALPRIGTRLDGFGGRDVRRLLIGWYQLRYELTKDRIIILRVLHSREVR
ncbi:type II toxin-antitoxin system RelE/ParE family toxin [Maricaulis sp.]|uniref:type II toxin-antitoxin system RelE/ParE family toxin n=1 Tax=Maricaulis sp. TaxID=1486257 RepID=UPI003A92486B